MVWGFFVLVWFFGVLFVFFFFLCFALFCFVFIYMISSHLFLSNTVSQGFLRLALKHS